MESEQMERRKDGDTIEEQDEREKEERAGERQNKTK